MNWLNGDWGKWRLTIPDTRYFIVFMHAMVFSIVAYYRTTQLSINNRHMSWEFLSLVTLRPCNTRKNSSHPSVGGRLRQNNTRVHETRTRVRRHWQRIERAPGLIFFLFLARVDKWRIVLQASVRSLCLDWSQVGYKIIQFNRSRVLLTYKTISIDRNRFTIYSHVQF